MSTATTANKKESDKFKDLCGPTDPKLDRDVREKLITARVGLLLRASFFGNLATRLKLVNADEWCPTAATDGRNFYYNSRFVDMLKPKEIEFLFGHEVLHCVYDHFGRRGDRDPQLFNVANDYCVNGDLKKHRVGEFITSVPCLYDHKYEGMSSEEIYDILYENAEKINIGDLIDKLLDDHLDGEGQDGDGDEGDEKGKKGGKGRPKLSPEEKQKIKDEIKEAVLAAASASDGAGNLPAGVKRIIEDMTAP
jgi:predicted metal-dependent peptidase